MVKRKHSKDENKENKKSKSTQEAILNFDEVMTKNLIDFSNNPTNDTTNEDDEKDDNFSDISSLDDPFADIPPNLPDTASIPVVLTNEKESTDYLQEILDAVSDVKAKLNKVLNDNQILSSKLDSVEKTNKTLKKNFKKQEKLTKVAIIQVIKLRRKNKKLLKNSKSPNPETIDSIVVPLIQERDCLKDELNRFKAAEAPIPNNDSPSVIEERRNTHTEDPETMMSKKDRVLPNWRQLFFRRRDEYKREYWNRSKAQIYEKYKNSKYLPRKYRPKFARTLEEYKVKEEAAFKSLDADRQCCILDADQAFWNWSAADEEALNLISENSVNEEEVNLLQTKWKKETSETEPKGRHLCQREIKWMENLPKTDVYKGFEGLQEVYNEPNSYNYSHNNRNYSDRNYNNRNYNRNFPNNNRYNHQNSYNRNNLNKNIQRRQVNNEMRSIFTNDDHQAAQTPLPQRNRRERNHTQQRNFH